MLLSAWILAPRRLAKAGLAITLVGTTSAQRRMPLPEDPQPTYPQCPSECLINESSEKTAKPWCNELDCAKAIEMQG